MVKTDFMVFFDCLSTVISYSMTGSKLNQLFLPLLFAVLLSISTKTKIGNTVDLIFYTLLLPVHQPVGFFRQITDNKITFIKNLPTLEKENRNLHNLNSRLLSENELLKQSITDSQKLSLKTNFKSVLPVRITGSIGNNTVTSSLPIGDVRHGQPLVSGTILLGTVSEIKGSIINIAPLDVDHAKILSVHTSAGQKGFYKFISNTPQITDIPSLSPLAANDYVFTEPTDQIPGNLVVGKVIRIISAAQEPLQKAEIRLETTLSDNPDNLTIILNP